MQSNWQSGENADLILGTDPDCDRVGIMIKSPSGDYIAVSGNQTGAMLLDYYIGPCVGPGGFQSTLLSSKRSFPQSWPADRNREWPCLL